MAVSHGQGRVGGPEIQSQIDGNPVTAQTAHLCKMAVLAIGRQLKVTIDAEFGSAKVSIAMDEPLPAKPHRKGNESRSHQPSGRHVDCTCTSRIN